MIFDIIDQDEGGDNGPAGGGADRYRDSSGHAAAPGNGGAMKNVRMTIEGMATCRLHRMTTKNPHLQKAWTRIKGKQMTPAVRHSYLFGDFT
jgi:hypothetical protein